VFDTFWLTATEITLHGMSVDRIEGDHSIGATENAMSAVGTFFFIDFNGSGFFVSLNATVGTRVDTDATLETDPRVIDGRYLTYHVNRRPLNIDDAFVSHRAPHLTTMATRTPLWNGDECF
jgi:hypothetical protein